MHHLPADFWTFHLIAAALALLVLMVAGHYRRKKHLIDDLPTSKVEGVFIGLVELKGTAESEYPLTSELAALPCVFYYFRVQEHWRRTETYRDKDGNSRTRTRSGWRTVRQDCRQQNFYLKDDTGVIRVLPSGAKIEGRNVFSRTVTMGDPLYYGKGPATAIADSTHKRRFIEEAIPLHHPIYLVGKAREREDVVAPEIAHDPTARLFLISTRTAQEVSQGYGLAWWGYSVGGMAVMFGGQMFYWNEYPPQSGMDPIALIWPWLVGYCGLWFGTWLLITFNSLVELRQRMRRAWSLVDIQLKRRSTLIPQIVSVVRGLQDHERSLQTELATLRAQANASEPGESGPDPIACSGTLRALREAYPALKSDEMFAKLQQELTATEQRIALARGYFNDVCTFYNTRLEIFPDGLIGKFTGFRSHPLITAENFERAPVKVQLSTEPVPEITSPGEDEEIDDDDDEEEENPSAGPEPKTP